MNRKDIIIISVLINAALLAVLFITATHSDDDAVPKDEVIRTAMSEPHTPAEPLAFPSQSEMEPYLSDAQPPLDEVDHVLRDYVPEESLPLESPQDHSMIPEHPLEPAKTASTQMLPQNYVEVTVKKGDMLEKIARTNGTTVQAIKEANKLSNDKLKIGQILKIPSGTGSSSASTKVAEASKPAAVAQAYNSDPVYYTVKNGDNPWKIAKQFGVKFDDILKLNNMSEDQARKLKVGDKIRVK